MESIFVSFGTYLIFIYLFEYNAVEISEHCFWLAHIIVLFNNKIKIIKYMKKLLDYDWSRAVQLICNSVQKCLISCSCNFNANKSIKMQKFL